MVYFLKKPANSTDLLTTGCNFPSPLPNLKPPDSLPGYHIPSPARQRTTKSPQRSSGVRGSLIYINHFYMTSIWGIPPAFPGTGRTEIHPKKPP